MHVMGRSTHPGRHPVHSGEVKIVKKASVLHVPPRHLPNSPHHRHTQDGYHCIENGWEGGREEGREKEGEGGEKSYRMRREMDERKEGSRGKGKQAYESTPHIQTPYCHVPWYSCHPPLSVQICCAVRTSDVDWPQRTANHNMRE